MPELDVGSEDDYKRIAERLCGYKSYFDDNTKTKLHEYVKQINDHYEKDVSQLLKSKWEYIVKIAEHLLQKNQISKDEIGKIMKGDAIP